MRELKFRVWSKRLERFLGKEEYCLDFDGKLIFVEIIGSYFPKRVMLQAVSPELYIVQQFTGLKDKNNKEIYEGDILESGYNEPSKIIEPVIFYHGAFYFAGNSLSKYVIIEKTMIVPHVNIIGNIFENPELLK